MPVVSATVITADTSLRTVEILEIEPFRFVVIPKTDFGNSIISPTV